jgi:hypothetical protein
MDYLQFCEENDTAFPAGSTVPVHELFHPVQRFLDLFIGSRVAAAHVAFSAGAK